MQKIISNVMVNPGEIEIEAITEMLGHATMAEIPSELISQAFNKISNECHDRLIALFAIYHLGVINGKRAERQRRSGGAA